MRIAVYDTHSYDRAALAHANERFGHELTFFEPKLTLATASMVNGHQAVCSFIHDDLSRNVLERLESRGVRLIDLRSAGYNHVDLEAAEQLKLKVARAPAYSPSSVAEHAVALLLALNRHLHHAYLREIEHNFSLEGMVGFDLKGKTVGVVGTGAIGAEFARIMAGFGCRIIAYDVRRNAELAKAIGLEYVQLDDLFAQADVISLHTPLTPYTRHIIDAAAFEQMKDGVVLINTSRGALVDTRALVVALKLKKVSAAGLDVYEEEEGVFHENLANEIIPDDVLSRLFTLPNVLVTPHQAFLTREALTAIADAALENARQFEAGEPLVNEVRAR